VPTGPNGEKHPADPAANAIVVARIAPSLAEKECVDAAKRAGVCARADWLSAERRQGIALPG